MGACISSQSNAATRLRKRGRRHPHRHHIKPSSAAATSTRNEAVASVIRDPAAGCVRDKYSFGKELGRGEFGVTYEVTTGVMTYACKAISKGKLRTEADVEDLRREVEIMRHLPKHPNIVEYKEAYEDDEAVYLVMELCQGGELFDRIVARGHYTERAAAEVVGTILKVVQVCHEHGVIHRDLKPENFLFANKDENSPLKAIDFGLSTFFEEGQRFGDIVGSPYYMAPEVLRRNYGSKVDVWSAGVILYILLCGVPPFWAVRGEIDFERDPWPKVSGEAKDLVTSMLDQNPYSRITLEEVLEHPWLQNASKTSNIPLGPCVMSRIKQFSLMNKFKKKVLRVVADYLPDEQLETIKDLFQSMDTDKNGRLSLNEVKQGFLHLGQPLMDSEIQMMIDAADADGDGTLDCEEFITILIHIKRMESDENLLHAFSYLDKNKSGFIELDELREALFEDDHDPHPHPHHEQVVYDIIFDIDLDKDGRISYEEFKEMMSSGIDWKMASRQYSRAMLNVLSVKMFNDKSIKCKD
ncbi:hypothetical protein V2J09_005659 [Rumex salicifolius]